MSRSPHDRMIRVFRTSGGLLTSSLQLPIVAKYSDSSVRLKYLGEGSPNRAQSSYLDWLLIATLYVHSSSSSACVSVTTCLGLVSQLDLIQSNLCLWLGTGSGAIANEPMIVILMIVPMIVKIIIIML